MTDAVVLAVDQGTSSTKAVALDASGRVIGHGVAAVGQAHPAPGWAEQDALEIWDSVRHAVRDALPGDLGSRVVAVGISNQRESLVLWDRATGDPLGPLLGWQDQRTAEHCVAMLDVGHGEFVERVSGLPLDPMFSALKARWLLDHHDPDRARSRDGELCLGTVDAWLLSRFGGEFVTEVGNASRTQLLDLATRDWSPELLDLFDIPVEVLPRVVASDGPFPVVRGLEPVPDGIPVRAVLGDSHAALFAHAGWRDGVVKATYGTGSSVMMLGDAPPGATHGVCRTIAWDLGGPAPALEGNIRSSGRTLTWLADLVGIDVGTLLAEAADADPGDVVLVPGFGGLGAPWWRPAAAGEASGLQLGTGRAQLAAAAVDAVVRQVEDVLAAMERAAGRPEVVLADGGLSRSGWVMQRQADISGRRFGCSTDEELSVRGAAYAAGIGAGLWTRADVEARHEELREVVPAPMSGADRRRAALWHAAVARAAERPGAVEGRG